MKQLQRMKEWINEPTEVRVHEIRRLNRILACLVYVFLVYGAVLIMDFLSWEIEGFKWVFGLVEGTIWETPLFLLVVVGIILLTVGILIPALWLFFSSSTVIDKEYVDDPERTARWRERREKKNRNR